MSVLIRTHALNAEGLDEWEEYSEDATGDEGLITKLCNKTIYFIAPVGENIEAEAQNIVNEAEETATKPDVKKAMIFIQNHTGKVPAIEDQILWKMSCKSRAEVQFSVPS